MDCYAQALTQLKRAHTMERFAEIYGRREGELARQLTRYTQLVKAHEDIYHAGTEPLYIVSAPGRIEIAGNHTDHNNGKVLAAAINLDCVSCVSPRADQIVHVRSDGFPDITLSLEDLSPRPEEEGTSASLVRGVAAGMAQRGYKIGGFDAAVTSDVLSGSGLSSSAAYEVMVCAILDALYNGFTVHSTTRAQISQYAENVYFGKPSGLMDQMASSTGGLVAIDFKDEPVVQPLSFHFYDAGYSIVVVNTGSSHENLTGEYASIREEMQAVAEMFGEKVLRSVRPDQLWQKLGAVRDKLGERAVLRAFHYFSDNERVRQQVQALQQNDLNAMFQSIIASGRSSWMMLQNVYPAGKHQPLALALAMAQAMLEGKGAWRVHGGGFAGTTLNFVPNGLTNDFVRRMEAVFGEHCCLILDVRSEGAVLSLASNMQK